jgi:hypothetical protein|tara:strand:- start:523 stop:642 length:120 start_codon:yes stop_codon:yes gene_type:complete
MDWSDVTNAEQVIEMYISMGYNIEEAKEIADQIFEEVGE